jgi:hypothetical protein
MDVLATRVGNKVSVLSPHAEISVCKGEQDMGEEEQSSLRKSPPSACPPLVWSTPPS